MRKGFALTAALAVGAMAFTLSATTADAAKKKKVYRNYGAQTYQSNAYAAGGRGVVGRRDASSLDGVRTGQPRTCGFSFFQYDDRGVPTGPYCN